MVETWRGGMSGSGLVLLFGLQACVMNWYSVTLAENIQHGISKETEFQIFKNSKLKINPPRTLYFQDSDGFENDLSDLENSDFYDAQWTAKPNLDKNSKSYKQNFKKKKRKKTSGHNDQKNEQFISQTAKHKDTKGFPSASEDGLSKNDLEASTQPPFGIETTPLYTEPITTEMDTTHYVTETVTQPITTEMEYEATTDEDEMLRGMHRRWKRGDESGGNTVTTPDPATTSVPPGQRCTGRSYYNAQNGNCSCPQGTQGDDCGEDMSSTAANNQERSTITYTGYAGGAYDNTDRARFENEITQQLSNRPNFQRVFVHRITYNATSNYSTITFDVIYNEPVTPDESAQSSNIVSNVTANILPVNINGRQVEWAREGVLTITEPDGTVRSIPVSQERTTQICYIFDRLEACRNLGVCVNTRGRPVCRCTSNYHGRYCEALIRRIDDTEAATLAVLLPVLVGVCGLVLLCSCCFAIVRRVNRGEGETASTVSSDVPPSAVAVPKMFFHNTNWRHFDRGPIMEEEVEVEYHREIIEQDYERDSYLWEPNYTYVCQRPRSKSISSSRSSRSSSSSSSSSDSSRGSWVNKAPRLGRNFRINRPDYDSDSNNAYF